MWVFKTSFGHKTIWWRKQFIFMAWISNTFLNNIWDKSVGPSCKLLSDSPFFFLEKFVGRYITQLPENTGFGFVASDQWKWHWHAIILQSLVRNIQVQPPPARSHPYLLLQGAAPLSYQRHVGLLWIWVPWWTQGVTCRVQRLRYPQSEFSWPEEHVHKLV